MGKGTVWNDERTDEGVLWWFSHVEKMVETDMEGEGEV